MTLKYRVNNPAEASQWFDYSYLNFHNKSQHIEDLHFNAKFEHITYLYFDTENDLNKFFDDLLFCDKNFTLPSLTNITIENSDLQSFRYNSKYSKLFPASVKVEFKNCSNYTVVDQAFNKAKNAEKAKLIRSLGEIFPDSFEKYEDADSSEGSEDDNGPVYVSVKKLESSGRLETAAGSAIRGGSSRSSSSHMAPVTETRSRYNASSAHGAPPASFNVHGVPASAVTAAAASSPPRNRRGVGPSAGESRSTPSPLSPASAAQRFWPAAPAAASPTSKKSGDSDQRSTQLESSTKANPSMPGRVRRHTFSHASNSLSQSSSGSESGDESERSNATDMSRSIPTWVGGRPLEVFSPKQEERSIVKIQEDIKETIRTFVSPTEQQRYSIDSAFNSEIQVNTVQLYCENPDTRVPTRVLEATSDTVYVSSRLWTKLDGQTLENEKALVVLGSLGIPPCPEEIEISNENSSLGKNVRAAFENLKAQEATLVVSVRPKR